MLRASFLSLFKTSRKMLSLPPTPSIASRACSSATTDFKSINSWSAVPETSPNANCPLKKEGKHYVIREECRDTMPKIRGMDYIDSDIVFMNFHEDSFAVCVSSDKRLCDGKNYDPENRILHYYMPLLSNETFDHNAVAEMLDFFDNEYPHRQALKDMYGQGTYAFLRNNARTIACMPYLSTERKKAYYVQFSMLFTFDDLAEHLTTLEDQQVLQAYRRNTLRILFGRQQQEPRIDLSSLSNFPAEYMDKAQLQEQLQADISQRLLRHAGPNMQKAYARSFEYYMRGVDMGRDIVSQMRDGTAGKHSTHQQYMQARAHSAGGTLITAASLDEQDAAYYLPDSDGLVSLVDVGMVTEADLTSYHREKSYDKFYKRLVTVNYLDWPVLVDKKSILKAGRESVILHNHVVQHLLQSLSLVPVAHRERYKRCLDNVLMVNDYSFFVGQDQINTRYGWYPVHVKDAAINLDRYKGDQTIGQVADVDLTRIRRQ